MPDCVVMTECIVLDMSTVVFYSDFKHISVASAGDPFYGSRPQKEEEAKYLAGVS